MKLILFDIDGTLIRSNSAGRTALQLALEELFGTAGPIDNYKMSGKTDHRIVTDLLSAVGISATEIEESLPTVYRTMAKKAEFVFPQKEIDPCIGVPILLEQLQTMANIMVGLLTGNCRDTAPLKLAAAGIVPTQFQIGAYGSDSPDRNDLPAIAMQRATTLNGHTFTGSQTVIIGDTPADILCARAGQATAVAVASGWHAADTLSRYKPDHLFENLSDTKAVLKALL